MKFIVIVTFLLVWTHLAYAAGGFKKELTISMGMVNNSVVENDSNLQVTDPTVVTSEITSYASEPKPVSNISIELNWSFWIKKKSAFGIFAVAPLMVSEGTSFFMTGMRYRYFIYSMSSGFEFAQQGITFNIKPRMRYYVGGSLTGGYLIYNTESAKKTDASLNLGLEGGVMYQWNKRYSINGNIAMVKRTGVVTSGIGMNIFVGIGIVL